MIRNWLSWVAIMIPRYGRSEGRARPRLRLPAWLAVLSLGLAASPAAAAHPPPPAFIANAAVVNRTEALAPGLVSRYFNIWTTFEFWNGSWSPSAPSATRTAIFQDEAKLEAAISTGNLPPGTQTVIYDDEKWNLTPLNQQQDPGYWYERAANAAHAAGLSLIAAPGTDLANIVNPGSTPAWQRYLAANIAAQAARYADIYDVQAQSLEANTTSYESYVHQAAQQALASNPGVNVMAGLSTNLSGVVESSSVMLAAAQASENDVWGWWINDPVSGPACSSCTGPYPQTVVDFLNGLASLLPTAAPPPTTSPPPSASGSVQPPVLSALRVSPRKFRAARTGKSVTTSPGVGTKVRFKLNVAANLRFTVKRQTEGRRTGNRCQELTPKNRTKPRCNYWRALKGRFTLNGKAGDNSFRFSGRFNRATLGHGVYRLIATPIANGITGSAQYGSFTLVREPRGASK